MSSQFFTVKEHIVEAQHIREYPRATAQNQEEVLHLAVKQYIPKSNPNPRPGDVTIIAAHANGFVKEMYEPMWDDLLAAAAGRGFRIRGIWIADVAWQGSSSVLNEDKLGNDPSWCDHSRDLLHMINMLRAEMPRPLVGVGHSFGGTIITYLSLMHPRLFTTLVLMDPVINFTLAGPSFGFSTLALSAVRRDLWPSRQAAAASFGRSAFYQRWDPRVLRVWIEHGIRETPTALYPDAADAGKATLTSTKHMEIFTYLRPTLQGVDPATGHRVFARSHVPDIGDDGLAKLNGSQLYRPEVPNVATQLPQVRPGVLWICGGDSLMSTPELRKEKMDLTGVGVGGSGGVAAGRVREVVLEGVGHLVAMDKPTDCARHTAEWIGSELALWREGEKELEGWWSKSRREQQVVDDEWQGFIDETQKATAKHALAAAKL